MFCGLRWMLRSLVPESMREEWWRECAHKKPLQKFHSGETLLCPLLFAIVFFLAYGRTDFSFSTPRSNLDIRGLPSRTVFRNQARLPAGFLFLTRLRMSPDKLAGCQQPFGLLTKTVILNSTPCNARQGTSDTGNPQRTIVGSWSLPPIRPGRKYLYRTGGTGQSQGCT